MSSEASDGSELLAESQILSFSISPVFLSKSLQRKAYIQIRIQRHKHVVQTQLPSWFLLNLLPSFYTNDNMIYCIMEIPEVQNKYSRSWVIIAPHIPLIGTGGTELCRSQKSHLKMLSRAKWSAEIPINIGICLFSNNGESQLGLEQKRGVLSAIKFWPVLYHCIRSMLLRSIMFCLVYVVMLIKC